MIPEVPTNAMFFSYVFFQTQLTSCHKKACYKSCSENTPLNKIPFQKKLELVPENQFTGMWLFSQSEKRGIKPDSSNHTKALGEAQELKIRFS